MYVLRLKELRRAAGFKTQKEIADALGVKERTYASWEREEVGISLDQAYEICEVIGCTPNDLCGWEYKDVHVIDEVDLLSAYRRLGALDRDELVELAEFKAARADSLALEEGGAASA